MSTTTMDEPKTTSPSAAAARFSERLALIVSAIALAGSLYLTLGMKLKACPLCLYERTFVMAIVSVLAVGWFQSSHMRAGVLALLSLPLAVGGLGVAAFHVYLEMTRVLECPAGVFGLGSAPQQSLAAFCVVTGLLGLAVVRTVAARAGLISMSGAAGLGVLFAVGAVLSAPPLPARPVEPYATPIDGCRPAFVAPQANPL